MLSFKEYLREEVNTPSSHSIDTSTRPLGRPRPAKKSPGFIQSLKSAVKKMDSNPFEKALRRGVNKLNVARKMQNSARGAVRKFDPQQHIKNAVKGVKKSADLLKKKSGLIGSKPKKFKHFYEQIMQSVS